MGEPFWRIRDYDRLFKVAQSRKMVEPSRATWTPIPISFTGRGYNTLMERPDGMAIFGAFILLVEVAAKCPKPGNLISDDSPLTPEDIARITRADKAIMQEAFKVLASKEIRWIELVLDATTVDCATTAVDCTTTAINQGRGIGQDRIGQDRRERQHAPANDFFPPEGFPARFSARLQAKSHLLGDFTPGALTASVLGVTAYQTMPEDEWFRAADEFASLVNSAGEEPRIPRLQAFIRSRFDQWTRSPRGPSTPSQKNNGAAGIPVNHGWDGLDPLANAPIGT